MFNSAMSLLMHQGALHMCGQAMQHSQTLHYLLQMGSGAVSTAWLSHPREAQHAAL